MGQYSKLDLAVVGVYQTAVLGRYKHLSQSRAELFSYGYVLQVGLRARESSRGRHGHLEVCVYSAVGSYEREQTVGIGALQLAQLSIFQNQ